jgi:hypothetical protein
MTGKKVMVHVFQGETSLLRKKSSASGTLKQRFLHTSQFRVVSLEMLVVAFEHLADMKISHGCLFHLLRGDKVQLRGAKEPRPPHDHH